MSGNIVIVNLGSREFKLIGTAHVSRGSIDEVKKIICDEKPDMVCVELDQGRLSSITKNDNWEKLDLSKVFKEGKGFLLIANLVLASFQKRLGNELGVKPGEEMKVAVETAQELGIPYSLCDREVHTTLRRAWAKCGFWSKSKLLASLLASAFTKEKLSEQEVEKLKDKSELDGMMGELADYLPAVKTVLIDERDRYLASRIWTSTPADIPKKITAVVGAGHMKGMILYLEKLYEGKEKTDVSELDVIPPKGFLSKTAGFIIPAAIIALIAVGFIGKGAGVGFEMILRWVLWNGSLAALGSLLALAHPLAVLVSFLGAPFATLNPLVGVGLFSGLVQIAFRKPRVCDVENISEDATSVKGVYRNRITKALLVFFLSSLGGAIGNFISFPAIAGLLAG
ncbi:MAG: TraB/GumN family protein [Treponema sp.]|nr:TraB/GumN family protein [Treponema sp.]MCL2271543.1 TraB/GumN family protein [Treponema sp.]